MKEEIIKQAKEKGFESKLDLIADAIILKILGDEFNHLWLCELQKWLREKHNIQMSIVIDLEDGEKEFYIDIWTIDRKNFNCEYSGVKYTYELAQEEACFEALKLIK